LASPANNLPLAAREQYRKLCILQAERALGFQFQRMTDIANGGRPTRSRTLSFSRQPPPASPADIVKVLVAVPPYTSGNPNPEYLFNTTTGTEVPPNTNMTGTDLWEFGDPLRGRISIGTIAGIGWFGGLSPLTGVWLLGDATTIAASLSQVVGIVDFRQKNTAFECSAEVSNPLKLIDFGPSGCINLWPGKADAALNGFVGAIGALEMTATLFAEGSVLSSQSSVSVFAEIAANALTPGTGEQVTFADQFLWAIWDFDAAPNRTITGTVLIPFNPRAEQLVIETTIRMIACRGGIKDPNGGSVVIDLADGDNGADPFTISYYPFSVPKITANRIPWEAPVGPLPI